ncbi:hypothetical protein Psuf_066380 [Phytohabitans suffuscus]|uniref:Uncharacterized protein n=1 Tax=Phytohabitans suffuscus TaxID=624315 RepID=A0A6F8YT17_9ACTN|nr:hypothetical protein Psuf_066380 [Phytohabitans suffuscus]
MPWCVQRTELPRVERLMVTSIRSMALNLTQDPAGPPRRASSAALTSIRQRVLIPGRSFHLDRFVPSVGGKGQRVSLRVRRFSGPVVFRW